MEGVQVVPDVVGCTDCGTIHNRNDIFLKLEFKGDEPVYHRLCRVCMGRRGLLVAQGCDCASYGVMPGSPDCPNCFGTGKAVHFKDQY
jgi:hypothetical protein